jgi:hypothetical protein
MSDEMPAFSFNGIATAHCSMTAGFARGDDSQSPHRISERRACRSVVKVAVNPDHARQQQVGEAALRSHDKEPHHSRPVESTTKPKYPTTQG